LGEGKGHCRNSKETNDASLGSSEDRSSTKSEMGQIQAREESRLKKTAPRIQSPPLSLIHPQLKIGTANQRHPFSSAAILLSNSTKETGLQNGNRNSKVV
jgi:hypothetical protein